MRTAASGAADLCSPDLPLPARQKRAGFEPALPMQGPQPCGGTVLPPRITVSDPVRGTHAADHGAWDACAAGPVVQKMKKPPEEVPGRLGIPVGMVAF